MVNDEMPGGSPAPRLPQSPRRPTQIALVTGIAWGLVGLAAGCAASRTAASTGGGGAGGGGAGGSSPQAAWFPFTMDGFDATPTNTDQSSLNSQPAGAAGFVTVVGGHFVDGHGQRLRILGMAMTGSSCFPPPEVAPKMAAHLRKLGINGVRLHFMDYAPTPVGIFTADGRTLDDGQLDKLDHLVSALKENGIYVDINLHVVRTYPELDPDTAKIYQYGKILDRFYPPFIEDQKQYARDLIGHVNPYTGSRYADEPAVISIELNNENTIFPSWAGTPDALPPVYDAEMRKEWNAWLSAHYASVDAVRTAWTPAALQQTFAVPVGATFADASVPLPRTTTPGPAGADFIRFLGETELAASRSITAVLRDELGAKSLIVDSQADMGGLAGLRRESTESDYIDTHGYWQLMNWENGVWDWIHWRIPNTSQVAAPDGGRLGILSSYRLSGMPFSVSEYNTEAPNDFAAETFPMLAATAAFQDWDAIFFYTYLDSSSEWNSDHILGFNDLDGQPGRLVFAPAAAAAFRQGRVSPGAAPLVLSMGKDLTFPDFDADALPRSWKAAGGDTALVTRVRQETVLVDGTAPAVLSATPPTSDGSDSGELAWRHGADGLFTVDTPSLRVAIGFLSGRATSVGDVMVTVGALPERWAAIALVALDNQPLASSRRVLLSTVARVENQGMAWNATRTSVGNQWGHGPTIAEPVPITVALPGAGWQGVPLDGQGAPVGDAVSSTAAGLSFGHPGEPVSLWYVLTRP